MLPAVEDSFLKRTLVPQFELPNGNFADCFYIFAHPSAKEAGFGLQLIVPTSFRSSFVLLADSGIPVHALPLSQR